MSSAQDQGPDLRPVSTNNFIWAIVPVVFVFLTLMALLYVYYRRRRRGQTLNVQQRPSGQNYTLRRRAAGQQTTPDEGLNELGEAPPPYSGKADSTYSEPGDLEAGRSPPEYPAMPPRAVTVGRRTSV